MLGAIVWDIDPVLLHLGPLQIRYYGLLFAATIYLGFYIWRQQALKHGESEAFAESFLWWGVVAIVAGARLGHVFFYEPLDYLKEPWKILYFWQGGLASHGAAVGLVLALWGFGRTHNRSWFRVADYLAPAVAIAAGGVRLGNFFNSEIVGRATDGSWGVQFMRYCRMEGITVASCEPRHPSQLYEFAMGLVTWWVLVQVQKRDIRRAGSGLSAGVFLTVYFSFRFVVEFFKEFQTEQLRTGTGPLADFERSIQYHFTMGQWLSVIPVVAGLWIIARALKQPKDAIPLVLVPAAAQPPVTRPGEKAKRKR
jgi:phosphatidylglycerol:prolipoprotein diacylglycerol transferase